MECALRDIGSAVPDGLHFISVRQVPHDNAKIAGCRTWDAEGSAVNANGGDGYRRGLQLNKDGVAIRVDG